jgi:DNA relaxase NicK
VVDRGTVASAGIDYIAATGQDDPQRGYLRLRGYELIDDARSRGNRVREWTGLGYSGYSSGGVSVGTGDNGTIVRVSGGTAASVCREIIEHSSRVTRIDLQSTVRFSRDNAALGRKHASEIRRHIRAGGRERNTRVEHTFGQGDTLYVGSRSSNYYGRVYDKYRESKDEEYLNCWRYEVECKGEGAEKVVSVMKFSDDWPIASECIVYNWFRNRGVDVRYKPVGHDELPPIGRHETDSERQLRWLKSQVSPVVTRLLEWYSREDLISCIFDQGSHPEVVALEELPWDVGSIER